MNLPNKLTVLRIIFVPFFVAFLLLTGIPHNFLIAAVIFGAASLTDYFDGHLARKNSQITDFGKFADPLADKILVISAFVCFVQLGVISAVPVIIVLFREFAVTSIRLVCAGSGKVVAANYWGKIKTVSQIIAVVAVILSLYFLQLTAIGIIPLSEQYGAISFIISIADKVLIWISVIFAVISGIIYLVQNGSVLKNVK